MTAGFDRIRALFASGREAQPTLRLVFDDLHVAALLLDPSGRVLYANKHLLDLLGEPESGMVEADWFARFIPDERRPELQATFAEVVRTGSGTLYEEQEIQRPNGERRLIAWDRAALRGADGVSFGVMSVGRDVTSLRSAEERLRNAAMYDPLTGLPNRNLFLDRLTHHFARGKRRPQYKFAALFVNIDRFRAINSSLGHDAGDALLIQVGQRLTACLRPGDSVARLAGDEFALLIDEVASSDAAVAVVARIQAAFKAPFVLDGREVVVTASIGQAVNKARYARAEDLLRDADSAMQHAKAQGQAGHEVFRTSMHARAMVLLEIETELRAALEREALTVHYQPIVALSSGTVIGFEALARWERSPGVFIPPGDFIGIAEETGLINTLGAWVLRQACLRAREWSSLRSDGRPLVMSVNLSTKQFAQPDLVDQISRIVAETAVPKETVRLEITESVLMLDPDAAATMLARLHDLGVHVCIDDFGTGYSSLSYLLRFPAKTLKVDRSFVAGLSRGGQHAEMVRTIIALARNVGMDVVAEGVETAEQLQLLRSMGCDYIQGFLVSKAVPATAARALIEAGPLV